MAISTYAELQTAIGNWLNRADLTLRIPEFITLAEADIRRNLRANVILTTLVADSEQENLSASCDQLRSIRFDTDTRKYPLNIVTPETLAGLRRSGSGIPHYAAVADGNVLFDITPDTSYTFKVICFEHDTPLSDASPSNATLAASPDIYLYGALKEAELYLEHDERNPVWSAKYQKAVADENDARERAELGAAPVVARLPINFG